MKTLIISSSLSETSKSYILCKEISKRLSSKKIEIEFVDARNLNINPYHKQITDCMKNLSIKVEETDNIIIGMGVHCYSINDALKIILDNCFDKAISKFFGIACAAGGEKSYLSTQHLTQICMNEWRMIQLPRIVYATGKDFQEDRLANKDVMKRLDIFTEEFYNIGSKLIS